IHQDNLFRSFYQESINGYPDAFAVPTKIGHDPLIGLVCSYHQRVNNVLFQCHILLSIISWGPLRSSKHCSLPPAVSMGTPTAGMPCTNKTGVELRQVLFKDGLDVLSYGSLSHTEYHNALSL